MDVEVRKIINNIMDKMHRITWWMMEVEKYEISGKRVTKKNIDSVEDLNILFSNIQSEYRKLEKILVENSAIENQVRFGVYDDEINEEYQEDDDNNIQNDKVISFMKRVYIDEDEANALSVRIEEISQYIRNSYLSLRYIPLINEEGEMVQKSIYNNTPFEQLISSEAYLQIWNLSIMEKRIKSKRDPNITFEDKGNILYHVSLDKFSKKHAIKTLDSNIEHIKRCKDQYIEDGREKEYKDIVEKLYEQKYMQYLFDLNNRYNGMVQENDTGKFKYVKKATEDGNLDKLLGLTEYEVEQNIKLNIQDMKKELKFEIADIMDHVKFEDQIRNIITGSNKEIRIEGQKEEMINEER